MRYFHYMSFFAGILALPLFAVAIPGNGNGNNATANNNNNPRNLIVTEPTSKATPRTVSWTESRNADRGTVTNDHIALKVSTRSGQLLCSFELLPSVTEFTVNKTNCKSDKYTAYNRYTVSVTEVRNDNSSSDAITEDFVTGPPRLKRLRVKNRTLTSVDTVNVNLKWKQRALLEGVTEKYDYEIVRTNKPSITVKDGSKTMEGNKIRVKDLPKRNLKFRVRVASTEFGTGRWSKWKKFSLKGVE